MRNWWWGRCRMDDYEDLLGTVPYSRILWLNRIRTVPLQDRALVAKPVA